LPFSTSVSAEFFMALAYSKFVIITMKNEKRNTTFMICQILFCL